MPLLLAFNPLQPIINALVTVLLAIHHVIPSLGWSLIALALLVRLAFWPLAHMQFRSVAEMQRVQPLVKALQAKYKGDPPKLNAEMMALYKEHGVNPFAGCLPFALQLPILFSLYGAIISQQATFRGEHWGWIGSSLAAKFPHVLAASLADPDYLLLGLYIVSMYFSVRYGSPPATDPAQAQQQKIMAFMSPVFIAFIGRSWPSALILYWLSINIFTTAQQIYMFRRLGLTAGGKAIAQPPATKNVTPAAERNGTRPPALRNGERAEAVTKKRRSR